MRVTRDFPELEYPAAAVTRDPNGRADPGRDLRRKMRAPASRRTNERTGMQCSCKTGAFLVSTLLHPLSNAGVFPRAAEREVLSEEKIEIIIHNVDKEPPDAAFINHSWIFPLRVSRFILFSSPRPRSPECALFPVPAVISRRTRDFLREI